MRKPCPPAGSADQLQSPPDAGDQNRAAQPPDPAAQRGKGTNLPGRERPLRAGAAPGRGDAGADHAGDGPDGGAAAADQRNDPPPPLRKAADAAPVPVCGGKVLARNRGSAGRGKIHRQALAYGCPRAAPPAGKPDPDPQRLVDRRGPAIPPGHGIRAGFSLRFFDGPLPERKGNTDLRLNGFMS